MTDERHDHSDLYIWLDERLQQLATAQNEQHARIRNDMHAGFTGVNGRLDTLNGKANAHESQIAVLTDRSDRSERQSGVIGSITGGITAGVVLVVKSLLGK